MYQHKTYLPLFWEALGVSESDMIVLINNIIKSTKVLMPRWWQEPRAYAHLDASPYCMHPLKVCKKHVAIQCSQAAALCTQAEQYLHAVGCTQKTQ